MKSSVLLHITLCSLAYVHRRFFRNILLLPSGPLRKQSKLCAERLVQACKGARFLVVVDLAYRWTLRMEELRSPETSVYICLTTRRHILAVRTSDPMEICERSAEEGSRAREKSNDVSVDKLCCESALRYNVCSCK